MVGGKHWQFVTKNDKLKVPRKDSFEEFFFLNVFILYFLLLSTITYLEDSSA